MQGTETLHLVYQHLFHMAGHREQIILAVTIPEEKMSKYRAARKAHPEKVFVLNCQGDHKQSISTMLKDMKFKATFQELYVFPLPSPLDGTYDNRELTVVIQGVLPPTKNQCLSPSPKSSRGVPSTANTCGRATRWSIYLFTSTAPKQKCT